MYLFVFLTVLHAVVVLFWLTCLALETQMLLVTKSLKMYVLKLVLCSDAFRVMEQFFLQM